MVFKKFLKLKKVLIIFLYKYTCKVYQEITTIFENLFLKKNKANVDFSEKGYFLIPLSKKNYFNDVINFKRLSVNEYLNVAIPETYQIRSLIKKIFTKDLRDNITKLTGFNFSVDFLIIYDRKFIPNEFREVDTLDQAYSYRWHFDKPNSSNMLKIFVPINISNRHGALELINKKLSKNINQFTNIKYVKNKINFEGDGDIIYGFYPTLCVHKDGITKKNLSATQIMFQLNPHPKWVVNNRLYNKGYKKKNQFGLWTNEPKFPFFSYMFDKRLDL